MRGFSLVLRRWLRESKRLRMQRFREEWARDHGEYEFVGGPLDGEVIKWFPRTPYYMVHGVYREGLDFLMHYHALSPISHGTSWLEGD
jgi:hypothetical protein